MEIDGTLRGPNKPLPPTPTDLNVEEKIDENEKEESNTLLISNKCIENNIRRHNSSGNGVDSLSINSRLHLSQLGKAVSMPGVNFFFVFFNLLKIGRFEKKKIHLYGFV